MLARNAAIVWSAGDRGTVNPMVLERRRQVQGDRLADCAHSRPRMLILLVASVRFVGNSMPRTSPVPVGKTLVGAPVSSSARTWIDASPSEEVMSTVGRRIGAPQVRLSSPSPAAGDYHPSKSAPEALG
jgi:hypothetical protein